MPSQQMLPRYNNPGPSSSRYGYPYFQEAPYTYTPLDVQHYSSFENTDTGYQCQFEDETSNKENSYKQLKPTPGTSLPKKSGQQVRTNLSIKEKIKQSTAISPSTLMDTESPKAYKVCRCLYMY
jgi:hypothetical protein